MSVVIKFDKSNTWQYTNLDFVDGRVVLLLQSDSTISAINVKLEGESRTRLAGPRQPYNDRSDKTRTELEVHKVSEWSRSLFPNRPDHRLWPDSSTAALQSPDSLSFSRDWGTNL